MSFDMVAALDLDPHPEGGFYRQSWASPMEVTLEDGRIRRAATLIYYYLPAGTASAWHRVNSDEFWLAHTGSVRLEYGGTGDQPEFTHAEVLGNDLVAHQRPQVMVPVGVWQRTVPSDIDALVSCLVSPGFDFNDFTLAD